MSNLEKLEEELYGKEVEEDLKKRMQKRIFFPRILRRPPTSWLGRDSASDVLPKSGEWKFFKLFILAFLAVFIVGGALFLFLYLSTRGEELRISIRGRERIESGDALIIPIVFKNISRSALKEVEVVLTFPRGTTILEGGLEASAPPRLTRKLEDIAPLEERSFEITARFFGHENEEKEIGVSFLYRPENLRARFAVAVSRKFVIEHVPLAISWDAPESLKNGQEVEFKVHYTSNARATFNNLYMRLDYPTGFVFSEATPSAFVGDSIWSVGALAPGQGGTIVVKGVISGEEGEIKAFRGGLGEFNELSKEWSPFSESSREVKIAVTPLVVRSTLAGSRNGLVTPGDQLTFAVSYRNNTAFILRNTTIRASLEGDILDFSSLNIDGGGVLDEASRSIIWGPGNAFVLKQLEPEAGGKFTFSINTRPQLSTRNGSKKNLTVKLHTAIEAAGIPQALAGTQVRSDDLIQFKVRTKVILGGKVLYNGSPLKNSGPLPPRVGQETSYAVVFELRNFTNDLENVLLSVALPPNVKWLGNFSPQGADVGFRQEASEVQWIVKDLEAGVGVVRPALSIAFQVSLIPSEADVGKVVALISSAELSGADSFTGENILRSLGSLTTELPDDPTTSHEQWRVVK